MSAWRLLVVLLGGPSLGLAACAFHRQPPIFVDATLGYPRVSNESCSGRAAAPAVLRVAVEDALGVPVARTPVVVGPIDPEDGAPARLFVSARTDGAGAAVIETPGGHPYVVVVALVGFTPATRVVWLEPGCEGRMRVVLQVATTESLEALGRGP